jgi:hypothetical protein
MSNKFQNFQYTVITDDKLIVLLYFFTLIYRQACFLAPLSLLGITALRKKYRSEKKKRTREENGTVSVFLNANYYEFRG